MTEGELETSESDYEGDDDNGDDDVARPCSLSIDGVLLNSSEEEGTTQKMERGDHEEGDLLTLSVADIEIGGRRRTIVFVGGNNNANDARFVSSNTSAVLFESSDEE
eukprot:jgi/Undpi1/13190/HiC_scaffold_8.g02852.m1